MKYYIKFSWLFICSGLLLMSCGKFLNVPPKGVVGADDLNTPENVEKLVVAAYASLGNDHWEVPYTSAWVYGSVRSDDAYKGGLGTADQGEFTQYEVFSTIQENQSRGDLLWTRLYMGVQRANLALKGINGLSDADYPQKKQRQAEMRFVRGHFYFLLKTHFKKIPYIDENISGDSINTVSNVQYSDNELWNKIGEDFLFAADNLPPQPEQIGRPGAYTAKAYLAKLRLYQAYEQDDRNNVTNINKERMNEVVTLTNEVIGSGKYDLSADYAQNYLWKYENGKESIFAVQRSLNDGSEVGRIDMSTALNYPMYPAYGCCSFHRPSQNLVNAFQTGPDGLPEFDTFNEVEMKDSADFQDHSFDPRLDHTVGLPSHPFKYQNKIIYHTDSWTRGPELYGPFSGMKSVVQADCPCLTTAKGYAYPASSMNNDILKFDDLLLWKAEALIELGRQNEALDIINEVRQRAKNSVGMLVDDNGRAYSNYHVELYKPGENIDWTQANARKALQWERRLEFGMEGSRFFDLVRWGIAAEVLNKYFEVEGKRRTYLQIGHFTKNRDEYLPVPTQQIDLSDGLYQQNSGWK
jgi:hypothetical protein